MRFADFLKRKKIVVMVAYGGVGEFLFQLDLAKRLEKEGFSSIFLVKGKYTFFREIVQSSDLEATALLNAKGYRYFLFFPAIWLLSLMKDVTIINSFNSLFYRLPTRLFYSVANILGARVIVCKHERDQSLSYEQVTYKEDEMIWQRNSRIVRLLGRSAEKAGFPVLRFATTSPKEEAYIHIHPVGSSLRKSYPPKKLIRLLEKLHDKKIVLTLTPREKVWYLTRDIKDFLESKENITLKIKYFSFKEIAGLIANSEVFCTVNTGVLWIAIMLHKKVVVCDTFTDYEWNPSPYDHVTRLSHDYDEEGRSLHLKVKQHEDGEYFESMYLVTPEEVHAAIIAS